MIRRHLYWSGSAGNAAVLAVCILCVSVATLHAQDAERKRKSTSEYLKNLVVDTESAYVDRHLLDVYVRVMRYQTAGQDASGCISGDEVSPDDYLTIAVSNVRAGAIENVSREVARVDAQRSREYLYIHRNRVCAGEEECRMSYTVEWRDVPSGDLRAFPPNVDAIKKYVSYELAVQYKRRTVSHAGIMLYYESKGSENGWFIYDGIIPQINSAALDRLPLAKSVRGPSASVFKKARKREEVERLRVVKVDGLSRQVDEEARPIGYLPGDDAGDAGAVATRTAAACSPCTVQIGSPSSGQVFALGNGDYNQTVMPLAASSTNCSGSATWKLEYTYTRTSGRVYPGAATQTSSTMGQTAQYTVGPGKGGKVLLSVSTPTGFGNSTTAYIQGTAIPNATITARLRALYSGGATPDLLAQIASHESGCYCQFTNRTLYGISGRWPTESYDGGSHVGLMQVPNGGQCV